MARVTFDSLFIQHSEDGTIEPRQSVRIGGVTIGPGVRLSRGVTIGGIDLTKFRGRDFEVEEDEKNDILVITGIY